MRDYWGETMLERFQPDPAGLPTIYATRPLNGIEISVYAPGTTTLQTIYAARTGGATKTNPFTTGVDGYAEFWAESAGYDIKMRDTLGARIPTKTIGWNAVNGEAGGIPPAQLAPGITVAQLDAAITAALWKPGDLKMQGGAAFRLAGSPAMDRLSIVLPTLRCTRRSVGRHHRGDRVTVRPPSTFLT